MGYEDAQKGAHTRTAFRCAEKKYKRYTHASTQSRSSRSRRKVPATDVSEVLDFRKIGTALKDNSFSEQGVSRLEEIFDWPVYTLANRPGFYFIPDALSNAQQLHWTIECLTNFPQPPNRTNHNAMFGPIEDLWLVSQEGKTEREISQSQQQSTSVAEMPEVDGSRFTEGQQCEECEDLTVFDADVKKTDDGQRFSREEAGTLVRKLRWATVGLQFDWSKRAYNESLPFREIPKQLAQLAARLAKPAMEEGEFVAEAAIVNFYGPDDMLGGHVDDMEADMSKPIVSISLGCKAVFLLGGPTRDDTPTAMFVRSGDAVLMAGPARRCFHGVPRIFIEESESELPVFTSLPDLEMSRLRKLVDGNWSTGLALRECIIYALKVEV